MSSTNQRKWHSLGDFLKAKEERDKEAQNESSQQVATPAPTSEQEEPSTPVTPVTPVTSVTSVPPVTSVREEVAPRRDFTRVANSIVRDAIPAGIFTGKCKQLYDYLYTQTRGAIVPVRSTRIPTERVMRGAGMTRHTYRAHIHRLISFGLVEVEEKPGEHGGNIYTVYLPEEVESNRGDSRHRGDRGDTSHTGEQVRVVQGSQAHPGDRGLSSDSSTTSDESKTLFKTNTERSDDDEAFAELLSALKKASIEITGRSPGKADSLRWAELGEVLITEMKIAAARSESVSSLPAFFAEHLRRRLWNKNKKQLAEEKAEISKVSNQAKPGITEEQIRSCPDCYGTGMWYPEGTGFGKAVARCKHEKLLGQAKEPEV